MIKSARISNLIADLQKELEENGDRIIWFQRRHYYESQCRGMGGGFSGGWSTDSIGTYYKLQHGKDGKPEIVICRNPKG